MTQQAARFYIVTGTMVSVTVPSDGTPVALSATADPSMAFNTLSTVLLSKAGVAWNNGGVICVS
jgi:hypothetical protein